MFVHMPGLTPEEILGAIPMPVNVSHAFNQAAPGTVRLEKMAKPISRDGYWEVTYNFTILPPMIGEGI